MSGFDTLMDIIRKPLLYAGLVFSLFAAFYVTAVWFVVSTEIAATWDGHLIFAIEAVICILMIASLVKRIRGDSVSKLHLCGSIVGGVAAILLGIYGISIAFMFSVKLLSAGIVVVGLALLSALWSSNRGQASNEVVE